ncbi:hypothetical protein [Jannaschia sp. R86511]|uniref:hypothetical protein n=1 Tax=Jannaschia sp. R86511 TaxID=3093853 RepID=UPI0036D29440
MTYRLAHSLVDLRAEVDAAYPGRDKASDGWIGNAEHASRGNGSDHNPDRSHPLGIVRALDLDKDDRDGSRANIAQTVVDAMLRTKDPRVKYVIWRGRMFSSYVSRGVPAWTWRPYNGVNGHFEHVHVSVNPGSTGDRPGPWRISTPLAPAPATPDPEDTMTDEQFKAHLAAMREGFTSVVEEVRNLRPVLNTINTTNDGTRVAARSIHSALEKVVGLITPSAAGR